MTLRERAGDLDLVMGRIPLVTSRALGTEEAFGQLSIEGSPGPARSVIVGGLGFGATLRGVLAVVPEETRVIVVEKLEAVITLARTHAAHLVRNCMQDARVTIERADVVDVVDVIARERNAAAILLDVDNGPGWASFRQNARLYAEPGLERARDALAPGGIFAVWSR